MNLSNILFSILLGFICSIILLICFKKVIYKGPNSNLLKHQIIKYNNKCYKFVPKIYLCPLSLCS